MIDRVNTVFPEPDSPTIARGLAGGSTSIDTSSTTQTTPRDDRKYVVRPSTHSNG